MNPWEKIELADYEGHMAQDEVAQLQMLNKITELQLHDHPVRTVMILGAAGGNGLEHVDTEIVEKVYGVDINPDYLAVCRKRHAKLGDILELICTDISSPECILPQTELVIANLIIEHVGLEAFRRITDRIKKRGMAVSCVIQDNRSGAYVSQSPYAEALKPLDAVHSDISEAELIVAMEEAGFNILMREEYPLPDGKALVRIDFMR